MRFLFKSFVFVSTIFAFSALSAFAEAEKKSLTVDDAVKMAVENNISLKEQDITLKGLERSSKYAWNSVSPSLDAGASYSKPVFPSENGDGTSSVYGTASLSFTPSLFTTIKSAKMNYENGKLTYDTAVKTVELNVRKAFYKILYDKDNVKLQEQNLESAEKQYQQNLQKYNQGGISRLDVLSAQVSVENQKPKVQSAKTTLENDLASFKQTLGVAQEVEIELSGSLDELLEIGEITIEDVEMNSATLKKLENKLDLAKTSVLAARLSGYAPTLSASYRAQLSKTGSNDAVKSGSVSASVSIPLDSWLPWSSAAVKIADAKDDVETLELQIEDEKTTLKVSTDSYLRSIAESKSSIKSLQASVNLAKETYDMTLTAYQRGTKDLLSLQSALDNLSAAQVNLKSEAYSLISSILELENELGVPFGTLTKR